MLSRIKPTTGLSRALVLLIGTLCACMWAKSISAKTPQAAAPGRPDIGTHILIGRHTGPGKTDQARDNECTRRMAE